MRGARPHAFDLLVQSGVERLRLAEAALLFAADHVHGLRPERWLRRLDDLARRVEARGAGDLRAMIRALRGVLVDDEGFRGNVEDHQDPRDSLLCEVLGRRRGIPITLCVIWLDIAGQLGWPFAGANLPLHFMVRPVAPGDPVFIDVFHGAVELDLPACEAFLSGRAGQPVSLGPEHIAPAPQRIILLRMLTNLHAALTEREHWPGVLRVAQRMLALLPGNENLLLQIEMLERLISDGN